MAQHSRNDRTQSALKPAGVSQGASRSRNSRPSKQQSQHSCGGDNAYAIVIRPPPPPARLLTLRTPPPSMLSVVEQKPCSRPCSAPSSQLRSSDARRQQIEATRAQLASSVFRPAHDRCSRWCRVPLEQQRESSFMSTAAATPSVKMSSAEKNERKAAAGDQTLPFFVSPLDEPADERSPPPTDYLHRTVATRQKVGHNCASL